MRRQGALCSTAPRAGRAARRPPGETEGGWRPACVLFRPAAVLHTAPCKRFCVFPTFMNTHMRKSCVNRRIPNDVWPKIIMAAVDERATAGQLRGRVAPARV